MKTHPIALALLALLVTLLAVPTAHAHHVGGPPHEAGILCFDGANRGSQVRIAVRTHAHHGAKGRLIHHYPWLHYHSRQVCKRLSDIGVNVGRVVDIHHHPWGPAYRELRRPCNGGDGRYTVRNDGSNRHVFAQVGGWHIYSSNCTMKTDWRLPGHARHLLKK